MDAVDLHERSFFRVTWFVLFGGLVLSACRKPCRTLSIGPSPSNRSAEQRVDTTDVEWQSPIEVASGPARKGPWRMNDSTFHYVDDPTVAWLHEERLGVVWVDNQRQQVFFQRYDGERPELESPTRISNSPDTFSWLPRMATAGPSEEHVYVLWQEIVFSGGTHGGDAFFARSTDGGETFETPINLSTSKAGDGKGRLTTRIWDNGSLDVAVGPDGTIHAVWTAYEGALWYRRSTNGGESFESALRVAGTESQPARGPNLAIGPGGDVHLAWAVGEDETADIHLARSTDRGETFGEAHTPVETGAHADVPEIAVDRSGGMHLAWASSPEGHFQQYHVRYVRLDESLRTTDDPIELAGPDLEGIESAHFPDLQIDDGDPYVLWERYPEVNGAPRGLGFVRSTDGGESFAPPSIVPGTLDDSLGINGSLQGKLMQKLAVDDGRIAVVNSRFRQGEQSLVRLVRGRAEHRRGR